MYVIAAKGTASVSQHCRLRASGCTCSGCRLDWWLVVTTLHRILVHGKRQERQVLPVPAKALVPGRRREPAIGQGWGAPEPRQVPSHIIHIYVVLAITELDIALAPPYPPCTPRTHLSPPAAQTSTSTSTSPCTPPATRICGPPPPPPPPRNANPSSPPSGTCSAPARVCTPTAA